MVLSSVDDDAIASSNSQQTWLIASGEIVDSGFKNAFLRKASNRPIPVDPLKMGFPS